MQINFTKRMYNKTIEQNLSKNVPVKHKRRSIELAKLIGVSLLIKKHSNDKNFLNNFYHEHGHIHDHDHIDQICKLPVKYCKKRSEKAKLVTDLQSGPKKHIFEE